MQLQIASLEVQRCILLNLWRFEDQLSRVEAIYLESMETLPAGLRLDAMSGLAMLPFSTTILKGYRQFLTDAEPQVRRQVLDNLYNVDTTDYEQMIDQLKGMLLDTDSRVRQAAVRLFAKR